MRGHIGCSRSKPCTVFMPYLVVANYEVKIFMKPDKHYTHSEGGGEGSEGGGRGVI